MTTAQTESALSRIVLESWNRIRSSDEIHTLLDRRELAVAEIDIDDEE